ncbi:integrase core domain protein [Plakobranchus ocellatus]|uniref:Integrase core domain protein n=1 Tax=Plakobranchus ocellatus TaxID=259542 RepID=A0AAV3YQ20_9GAST|nr:integrase core domain protein [Plakobranchus ocellatus]
MADKSVPLPKELLPHPGDPVLPYKLWIRLFDNHIYMRDAARNQPSGDEDKNRLLFNLLSLEGIRIFSAQPMVDRISTASHDEFRSAVKSVFQVPINPFRAYYDLEQRRQGSTESTQDYLTALRSLMADCDFDGRENHHLAVRLVCGCFNHETQKKLLALPKIDLDEVVRIMQADESASHSQVAIGEQSVIHRLAHKPSPLQGNTKKPGTLICTNCGRRGHRAKDTICPALNQTCSLCGKLGHFKRVCRSGPAAKPAPKQRDRRTRALQTKVNAVSSRPFLHTVHLLSGKHFIPVTADVDTGAQISGVTEATYRHHFAHLPLLPTATLRNFDNTVLSGRSLGRFLSQVKNKNRRVCAEFYVLPPRCSAVIGQNLISALGLQIDGSTMEIRAVTHDSVDIAQDYPRLLSNELGTFPDYQHAIANSVRSFIFDPNAPTFVTTDASDVGLGVVLSQTQQGCEVPIAHISHTLQPRKSYAVNEKEALACVWACETWEKYLLGRHFTLRTGHSSLASLLRSTTDSRKSAKSTRWLDRLSFFEYTVEYSQGKDHLVADALSRLSMRSAQSTLHDPTHDQVVGALQTDHLSLLDVKSATKRDSTLSTVLRFVSSGWPSKKTLASLRNYRVTAATPQGRSQGEVMFHRPLLLPFQIPASAHRARPPSPQLATSASDAQGLHSRGPYRVGDRVLARRPQVLKGQSPWSKPLTVLKVLGNWTYQLSGGQRWNARKLRRYLEPEAPLLHHHETTGPPVRRSQRQNRGVPPARYPNELYTTLKPSKHHTDNYKNYPTLTTSRTTTTTIITSTTLKPSKHHIDNYKHYPTLNTSRTTTTTIISSTTLKPSKHHSDSYKHYPTLNTSKTTTTTIISSTTLKPSKHHTDNYKNYPTLNTSRITTTTIISSTTLKPSKHHTDNYKNYPDHLKNYHLHNHF